MGRYHHAACAIRGAMVVAGGTVIERLQGEGAVPPFYSTSEFYYTSKAENAI